CNMLSPIIDEIANENKNIKVYKVNIDEETNLVNKFNIVSVPAILIFKKGEITSRVSGLTDKNQILSMVK
uniref:thioredoxin family protein n=1 Tax=Ruminococcus bromii TaxID=40518 RepID=UPI003FEE9610